MGNFGTGPGQYGNKSDFEKTLILHGLSSKDSFLINDNGHINQKPQIYATQNKKVTTVQAQNFSPELPGPGQYETLKSDFTKRQKGQKQGPVINPITVNQAISPGRAAAIISNPSLQKMSVPSIPSRFMTPVIDANTADPEDSQDICKMSRLVDDPTKVGPGTYVINEE